MGKKKQEKKNTEVAPRKSILDSLKFMQLTPSDKKNKHKKK